MNPILLALFNLFWELSRGGTQIAPKARVKVWLTNPAARGCREADLRRMLRSSTDWIDLVAVIPCSVATCTEQLSAASPDGIVHLLIADGEPTAHSLLAAAHRRDLRAYTNIFPKDDPLALAFVREVAHHDFENGGHNEWNGAPTKFAACVLRKMSAVHCIEQFPLRFLPDIERLAATRPNRTIKALDIGCGPISCLRWGAVHGLLTITGVDPLLPMYRISACRHGHDHIPHLAPDESVSLRAECIDTAAFARSFELIYTNNALDHTQAPLDVMTQAAALATRDGLFIAQVATNEGTRQNWDQLHQFNMRVENDVFLAFNRADQPVVLAGPGSPWRIRQVGASTPDWTMVVLELA